MLHLNHMSFVGINWILVKFNMLASLFFGRVSRNHSDWLLF